LYPLKYRFENYPTNQADIEIIQDKLNSKLESAPFIEFLRDTGNSLEATGLYSRFD
jgi:uncharacterized protein Smg (DUF494 family)